MAVAWGVGALCKPSLPVTSTRQLAAAVHGEQAAAAVCCRHASTSCHAEICPPCAPLQADLISKALDVNY